MIAEGVARPLLVVRAVVAKAWRRAVLVLVFAARGEPVVDRDLLRRLVVCDPYVDLLGFQVVDGLCRVALYPFDAEGFTAILAVVGLVFDEVRG